MSKTFALGPDCSSSSTILGNTETTSPNWAKTSCPLCPSGSYWLNDGQGCHYVQGGKPPTPYCVAILDCTKIPNTVCGISQNGFHTNQTGCCNPSTGQCYSSTPTTTTNPPPGSNPLPGQTINCQVCPSGSDWNGMGCLDRSANPVALITKQCPGNACDPQYKDCLPVQSAEKISPVNDPPPPPPPCGATIGLDSLTCPFINSGIGNIPTDIQGAINTLFIVVLGLAGTIATILIIISGYRLMASQGEPEKVKEAREQLTAAIIGLLFIILSYTIVELILNGILNIKFF